MANLDSVEAAEYGERSQRIKELFDRLLSEGFATSREDGS
jgi:hypothetical protein